MLNNKSIYPDNYHRMSLRKKGNISLEEFCSPLHDVVSQEPFATQFANLSMSGNRRGMVEMLMEMPHITKLKLTDSYQDKNDIQATKLYEQSIKTKSQHENKSAKENEIYSYNILTKALSMASAESKIFLDALIERIRRSYGLKAFAKCLKDCECMLALPTSFYDNSTESLKYFMQRRKECLQLERECSRNLARASSGKRGNRNKACLARESSSNNTSSVMHAVVPDVDGKPHNYLESCSDSVMLQFDKTKGRHLVAARDIKPGAVLVVDQPFSYSTDEVALGRNCLHCYATLKLEDNVKIPCRNCQTVSFCTETCRKEAWKKYHQYECSVFDYFFENSLNKKPRQTSHLLLAYRTTVVQALSMSISKQNSTETMYVINPNFLQCHANAKNNDNNISKDYAELGSKKLYKPLDYQTTFQLETHCTDMEPSVNLIQTIEAIFFAKCLIFVLGKLDIICTKETFLSLAIAMLHHLQAINCNAYETVENVQDETTRVWNPRNIGGAIYPTVSLINHSCYPNVVRHSYPNGIVVVRALRFIGKGCEILDCYGPQFLIENRSARREFLWNKYRFICTCDACTENWEFPSETINYKCTCSEPISFSMISSNATQETTNQQCTKCERNINLKKIEKQLHKSIESRISAITKMYQGNYVDALPLLFKHAHFINKYLTEPNIEGIKTEQCIVQCYNSLGSISV